MSNSIEAIFTVYSSGKQCLCIYKRPKSPISAEAEVADSFAC